jgi:hypothetical protein
LKLHLPYHESDHVLNLACIVLTGGTRLEDIERLRHDVGYMNAWGPDPGPDHGRGLLPPLRRAGCERVDGRGQLGAAEAMDRPGELNLLGPVAYLDVDGTIVPTSGSYKQARTSPTGIWGYAPLIVTLANTRQMLYLVNRPGNAPATPTRRPGSTRRSSSSSRIGACQDFGSPGMSVGHSRRSWGS